MDKSMQYSSNLCMFLSLSINKMCFRLHSTVSLRYSWVLKTRTYIPSITLMIVPLIFFGNFEEISIINKNVNFDGTCFYVLPIGKKFYI